MSWLDLASDDPFGLQTLPYGVVVTASGHQEPAVRIGTFVLPLAEASYLLRPDLHRLFTGGNLDALLASGPTVWRDVRAAVTGWLTNTDNRAYIEPLLLPLDGVRHRLPFTIADYVDFYASEHHASNVGAMFRPGQPPLTPNWKHLPIGYHGRSGTVVPSGTDIVRPSGQRKAGEKITFGPSERLDIEAELGFVVGVSSTMGRPVPVRAFADHTFGVVLLNDWSARDIQAWEYVPLGPFLGKSFATSISAWVTPLLALEQARIAAPARDVEVLPYLDDRGSAWALDVALEVRLNGESISHPPYASMYWTPAQMLAHMTVNGASLRSGDLFGSGTISGPEKNQRGSLLELTWGGAEPFTLPDGTTRTFLEDGDEVSISATAPGPDGSRVGVAEVVGKICPGDQYT